MKRFRAFQTLLMGSCAIAILSGCHGEGVDVGDDIINGSTFGLTELTETKITASDGTGSDQFGNSVSVVGNLLIVGAESKNSNAGAAYVFARSGTAWTEQQKLTASDAASNSAFGHKVMMDGTTVIVGSHLFDFPSQNNAGAAYVFTQSGTTWSQQQKLTASDRSGGDQFGSGVDVSGTFAVVGAMGDGTGSAYTFTRSGTTWTQQAKVSASDGTNNAGFGASVAVYGTTIIVGAPDETAGSTSGAGAAYIFTQSGTTWTQQAKLTAPSPSTGDDFGDAVAINGSTVAIGAPGRDSGDTNTGAMFVFTGSGSSWTLQATLVHAGAAGNDNLGANELGLGQNRLVGGARQEDSIQPNSGAAIVYQRVGTTWTEALKLKAGDAANADEYGKGISLDGDTVLIGAYNNDALGSNSGAAYVHGVAITPPALTAPTAGSTFSGITATFTWVPNDVDVQAWALYIGSNVGGADIHYGGAIASSTLAQTVSTLPTDGRTVYVRLWYLEESVWKKLDYTFIAADVDPTTDSLPYISSPAPSAKFSGSTVTFTWDANGNTVTEWWLYVGDNASYGGISNLFGSGSIAATTFSQAVPNLPTDGRLLYARLYFRIGGNWGTRDFQYEASGTAALPGLTSPTAGTTFTDDDVLFQWTANGATVTNWWLHIGNRRGAFDLVQKGYTSGTTSATIFDLPTDGRTLYVRFFCRKSDGFLYFRDYTYIAGATGATVTSPAPGSTISGSSQLFSWNSPSANVTSYYLWVVQGSKLIYQSSNLGTSTSHTATGLPADGTPITVRIWYQLDGVWNFTDTAFVSGP